VKPRDTRTQKLVVADTKTRKQLMN